MRKFCLSSFIHGKAPHSATICSSLVLAWAWVLVKLSGPSGGPSNKKHRDGDRDGERDRDRDRDRDGERGGDRDVDPETERGRDP